MLDTVRAYNAQIYGATATSGRRTLEGIFKFIVPESKQKLPLQKLILEAQSHTDLAEPLRKLSDAIRKGGNLGAHFDLDNEPNETMARQIVELLDYLISYIYVLPDQISKLEDEIPTRSGQPN
nr:DUF4145 domain-containing protein [Aliiroseovarius sp. F20344]